MSICHDMNEWLNHGHLTLPNLPTVFFPDIFVHVFFDSPYGIPHQPG